MLNQTGVTRTVGTTRKMILVDEKNSTALSCMISDTGVTAKNGVKMVYAGTPLYGDLTKRDTPFTVSGKTGEKPAGLAHHDVDVTDGVANGGVIIFGIIDISKLEADVAVKAKAAESDLKMIQLIQ